MSKNHLNLYNYEVKRIYMQDNILNGYNYLSAHPEYEVIVNKDIGQHYFNKIGVCLKYLNSKFSEEQEDAVSRLHKAIASLLSRKWILYNPVMEQFEKTVQVETSNSTQNKCFYAVKIGRKPGIYSNWAEASAQVLGFPSQVLKKFKTKQEALEFLRK